MKKRKNVTNVDGKQQENKVLQQGISLLKEISERDQSSIKDENSFRNEEMRAFNKVRKKKLLGNFENIHKEYKYSFVVDWQIPK